MKNKLGMVNVAKRDFESGKFSLYFYTYLSQEEQRALPGDSSSPERWDFMKTNNKHYIELTHNWGTETDPSFQGYHTGNSEPRGFGHIALVVPDVRAAVDRLEREGVRILKHPDAGSMKGIAFVADPDGYWVEILALPVLTSS